MATEGVGSSGTAPTVGARVELLDKMINTLDQVSAKVNENSTALQAQEAALKSFQDFWSTHERNIRLAINELQAGAASANESLAQRKDDFERLRREMETSVNSFNISVKGVSDRVDTIKEIIESLKSAVKEVPSIENIRQAMVDQTSPLATKQDFSQANEKIASLDGKMTVLLALMVTSVALPLLRWIETVVNTVSSSAS
jgi:chromosome segregation ATPase